MQITSPYWTPGPDFQKIKFAKPIKNTLGFRERIPWPLPVTVGAIYSGSGQIPNPRSFNTSPFGEWYAVSNIIPSTGGVPMINVNEPRFQFSRAHSSFRI